MHIMHDTYLLERREWCV